MSQTKKSIAAQMRERQEAMAEKEGISRDELQKQKFFQYSLPYYGGKFTDVFAEIALEERVPHGLRKSTKPRWWYSTPFGTPRGVNLTAIRALASSWACQSIITAKMDDLRATEFIFVSREKDKSDDPKVIAKIDECTENAKNVNPNNESLLDVHVRAYRDLLEIDAYTLIKSFYEEAHEVIDFGEEVETTTNPLHTTTRYQSYVPEDAPAGLMGAIDVGNGGRFLKQFDQTGFVYGYWEHFSNITNSRNAGVARFYSKREIAYEAVNQASYANYGWSPVQQLYDILVSMTTSVLNTAKYMQGGAIAPGILEVRGVDDEEFEAFRDYWLDQLQGNPHRFGIINTPESGQVQFVPFDFSLQDITFLEGLDFYWRIVMAVFHITPSQLGITDTVNKATSEEQAKIDRRIGRGPMLQFYMKVVEKHILPEWDPDDLVDYIPKPLEDIDKELMQENVRNSKLANFQRTVNEYRIDDGLDVVWWGDVPREILMTLINSGKISAEDMLIGTDLSPVEVEDGGFNLSEALQNLLGSGNASQIDTESISEELASVVEITEPNEEDEDEEEKNYEMLDNNEYIILKTIERRGEVLPKKAFEEDDISEDALSRRIDEFIRDPVNEISEGIVFLLDLWKENLVEAVAFRMREGEEFNSALLNAIADIAQADSQTTLQIAQLIETEVTKVFRSSIQLDDTMDDEEPEGVLITFPTEEVKFLRDNSLILADDITTDMEKRIRRQLIEGLQKGEGIPELTKRVEEAFDTTPARAETIARTETIRALVEGRMVRLEATGAVGWQFFAHIDDRTSCTCRALHLTVYKLDDRENIPPIHPNCRCAVIAVFEDDEEAKQISMYNP
jgi:SPP1 gp7 family putative phage head morphogenesis protein